MYRPSVYALVMQVFPVFGQVERKHAREDERIILAWSNIDAIGLRQAEPVLRHDSNDLTSTADRILMLEKRPCHFQVIRAGDVNRKAIDERAEEVFAERGKCLSATADFVGRDQGEEPPVYIDHLVPGQIADDQPVMHAQDLAINLKDGLASFVHNNPASTETEELLADCIAHRVISLCRPTL